MAKILIVDDSEEIREMLRIALTADGHTTYIADNGIRAVLSAKTYVPDLILLDIVMPQMDGIEVCKTIRRNPKLVSTPIICISAKHNLEDKLSGFAAGADDYISKPFNLDELKARIEAVLRRHSVNQGANGYIQVGDLRLDPKQRELHTHGDTIQLTGTETSVMTYLMNNAGTLLPSARILENVWGWNVDPNGGDALANVRVYIGKLREKIEPDPAHPRYIQSLGRQGYTITG